MGIAFETFVSSKEGLADTMSTTVGGGRGGATLWDQSSVKNITCTKFGCVLTIWNPMRNLNPQRTQQRSNATAKTTMHHNGYGGDAGHTSNAAEVHNINNDLFVYTNTLLGYTDYSTNGLWWKILLIP